MERAAIEERRRGRAGAACLVDAVEFTRPQLAILLADREAHGDAHPENLRRLDAALLADGGVAGVNEVAVVQRLDADEIKLQIRIRIKRVGKFREAILGEPRIEPAELKCRTGCSR